jgi:hypothetical protein
MPPLIHPPAGSTRRSAFALDTYNWSTFGTWEFDPRHHAGYLVDVDFFNRELHTRFDNDGGALDEEGEL